MNDRLEGEITYFITSPLRTLVDPHYCHIPVRFTEATRPVSHKSLTRKKEVQIVWARGKLSHSKATKRRQHNVETATGALQGRSFKRATNEHNKSNVDIVCGQTSGSERKDKD